MEADERERLRAGVLERLRRDRAGALEMEVVYGTAHKGER
jgi:hypothetical protein